MGRVAASAQTQLQHRHMRRHRRQPQRLSRAQMIIRIAIIGPTLVSVRQTPATCWKLVVRVAASAPAALLLSCLQDVQAAPRRWAVPPPRTKAMPPTRLGAQGCWPGAVTSDVSLEVHELQTTRVMRLE